MTTFTPAEATVFEMHGTRFRSFVRSETGGTDLRAWRVEIPPGVTGVGHRPTREEVLLVLDGQLTGELDGRSFVLGPADVLLVSAGSTLRIDSGPTGGSAWVTTVGGLQAVLPDGSVVSPPWAR